ncbi:MAG: MdtA/MuxA family multidrug efflux RND transporter periplasmic adaptor subunit, partial [Bryobacteraceae bacterium]
MIALGVGAYFFVWPRIQSVGNSGATGKAGRRGRGVGTMPVVVTRVKRGDIGVYDAGLGTVTPIYMVTVKSRVDGQLMALHYKEGQMVHQGDLLLEIDPRPYEVQLAQAEGQLLHDQALLKNAQIDLERYKVLYGQDAIPQQQFATQEALVTQYQGTLKTDQAQIDNAKLNLTYCHITSPITGLIGLRLVDPGNIVHASDSNGLLVIAQLQPISAIFTIAEDQLPPVLKRFRTGQSLPVDAWDRDQKTLLAHGALSTIDNQIDQTTGTLKLRATFQNTDSALFPNQFVNARLLVEQKHGVALVPNGAIQRNTQAIYVWLVKPDNTVTVRNVTVGVTQADESEITAGVNPGDLVVTDGVDKLQEGGKVRLTIEGEA